MTYGFRRAEILSAQANGITLLVLAVLIVFEAIRRLLAPPDVDAGLILAVASSASASTSPPRGCWPGPTARA